MGHVVEMVETVALSQRPFLDHGSVLAFAGKGMNLMVPGSKRFSNCRRIVQ